MNTASIINPYQDIREDGRCYYIDLRAACPWCGHQIIFGAAVLDVEFNSNLQKHQDRVMVHTHPDCGRLVIVKGKALRKYTNQKNTWELTADEKANYTPREGDRFKYDAGDGEEVYIITDLPSRSSENTLNTIHEFQLTHYNPWGRWFHPSRSKIPKTGTIEDIENYTGIKFPRFIWGTPAPAKPSQISLFYCL